MEPEADASIDDIYRWIEDAPNVTFNIWENFADDHDSDSQLTYAITVTGDTGVVSTSLNSTGILTLDFGDAGIATVKVEATDNCGEENDFTFRVYVVEVTGMTAERQRGDGTWEETTDLIIWNGEVYRWTPEYNPMYPDLPVDNITIAVAPWEVSGVDEVKAASWVDFATASCFDMSNESCLPQGVPTDGRWSVTPIISFGTGVEAKLTTTADRAKLTFEMGDPDTTMFSEVDMGVVTERWVGESNRLRVTPVLDGLTYQWTVPGYHIWTHELGENEETGKVIALEAADYQRDWIHFHWMESSGGDVYGVTVNVTLDGQASARTAKFVVKTPLVSVLVNDWHTELVAIPPDLPLGYKYIFGAGANTPDDTSDDVAGINIVANVIDAPAGSVAWTSLMDWVTHVNFVGNPFPLANPNTGPGPYTLSAKGLDTEYAISPPEPNVFNDFPVMSFLASTAGDGGTIDHRADFKTYLLWRSDRAGSIPATLRRVDWTWAFTASTIAMGGGVWGWGAPIDASSSSGGIITSEVPEWDAKVVIGQHKFKPDP